MYPPGVVAGDEDVVIVDHYEMQEKDRMKVIIGNTDGRIPSICLKSTNNAFYQRSQANIAAAIGVWGTGWSLGTDNYMVTNLWRVQIRRSGRVSFGLITSLITVRRMLFQTIL
ncbi:MAG: hypothetical protein H7240_09255 [Glaciimonas sp.]|nr:hypothetical protein [Glaciimonas sp.]